MAAYQDVSGFGAEGAVFAVGFGGFGLGHFVFLFWLLLFVVECEVGSDYSFLSVLPFEDCCFGRSDRLWFCLVYGVFGVDVELEGLDKCFVV